MQNSTIQNSFNSQAVRSNSEQAMSARLSANHGNFSNSVCAINGIIGVISTCELCSKPDTQVFHRPHNHVFEAIGLDREGIYFTSLSAAVSMSALDAGV